MGGGFRLTTGHACRFDLPGDKKTLVIGNNCEMGDNVHIVAYEQVSIGNDVLIASKVFISDTNHGEYREGVVSTPYSLPNDRPLGTHRVSIGDRTWVGENVVILQGVSIGSGCIIGANSVVNRSIKDNCIAAGCPVKILKTWNKDKKLWEKYLE